MKQLISYIAILIFTFSNIAFATEITLRCKQQYGSECCWLGNENFEISFTKETMRPSFSLFASLDIDDRRQIDSLITLGIFKSFSPSIRLNLNNSYLTDYEQLNNSIEYLNSFIQINQIIVDCPSNFIVPNCLFIPKELNHIWLNTKYKLDFGNITYKSNTLQKLSIDANDELIIKNIDKLSIYNYIDKIEIRAYVCNIDEMITNLCKLPYIGHLSLDLNFVSNNKKHYITIPDNAFMINTERIFYRWVDLKWINSKTPFSDSLSTVSISNYTNLEIPFWWYLGEWRNPPIDFSIYPEILKFIGTSREIKAKFRKIYFGFDIKDPIINEDSDDSEL